MGSRLNPQNLIFKDGSNVPLITLNSTLNNLILTGDTGSNDVLLTGILAPVSNNDAVNKGYVNTAFVRIDGTSTMTGELNMGSYGISNAGQLTSTVTTGTAPLSIASTTLVPNLYVARSVLADSVSTISNLTGVITSVGNVTSTGAQTGTGNTFVMNTSPTLVTPVIGAATGTSLSVSGQLTSTLAIGTPPIVVTSTTLVPNLFTARSNTITATADSTNASRFLTFVNSSTTGAQGIEMATGITVNPSVNTLSVTGQLISTIATGTAPIVVSSTTLVPSLYVARSALSDTVTTNANLTGPISSTGNTTSVTTQTGTGSTFVMNTSPTLITPILGAATGTSLSVSGQLTSTVATGIAPLSITSTTLVPNLYVARSVLADSTTTNANLTGPITSVGNATSVASQTGTGSTFVMNNSPTLVTPNIGDATGTTLSLSGQLTSTVVQNTPPFVVTSTTIVANLTSQYAQNAVNQYMITDTQNQSKYMPFTQNANGYSPMQTNSGFVLNPGTGVMNVPTLAATSFINAFDICNGRLTLTTGVPVTTTDVTSAGTLYWTPYKGSYVAIYNGTQWLTYQFTEINITLATLAVNCYDVFVSISGGVPVLSLLVWTNTTTRATALALQNGVYVLSGTTTKRYLGTVYVSATGTTSDAGTTLATTNGRYVWNYYNRISKVMSYLTGNTSSACPVNTARQWNGDSNAQLQFCTGVVEDSIIANMSAYVSSGNGTNFIMGFGLNTSGGFTGTSLTNGIQNASNTAYTCAPSYIGFVPIGRSYLVWIEATSGGSNTGTTYGGTLWQNGIIGYIRC